MRTSVICVVLALFLATASTGVIFVTGNLMDAPRPTARDQVSYFLPNLASHFPSHFVGVGVAAVLLRRKRRPLRLVAVMAIWISLASSLVAFAVKGLYVAYLTNLSGYYPNESPLELILAIIAAGATAGTLVGLLNSPFWIIGLYFLQTAVKPNAALESTVKSA